MRTWSSMGVNVKDYAYEGLLEKNGSSARI